MYFDVSKTAIYELNTIIGNNSHLLCVKNKFCLGKAPIRPSDALLGFHRARGGFQQFPEY